MEGKKLDKELWLRYILAYTNQTEEESECGTRSVVFVFQDKKVIVSREFDASYSIEEDHSDGRCFVSFTNKPIHKLIKLDLSLMHDVLLRIRDDDHFPLEPNPLSPREVSLMQDTTVTGGVSMRSMIP